jgi:hypothetical protein
LSLQESFNRSGFSKFLNRPAGRVFRFVAGTGFVATGVALRHRVSKMLSLAWSFFPLSAGAFDVCYISAALGGPFSGDKIRSQYQRAR